MTSGLADRLKTATRSMHTAVERGPLMHALLRGTMSRGAYCVLLRNLHALYERLESTLETHASATEIAVIYEPALWRTRVLADDLSLLHGSHWADELPLAGATLDYTERLHDLSATRQTHRLLAHAYVRYLGDLSGGQMLRDVVSRGMADPRAVAFYEFGDPARTAALKASFRAGIDALALGADKESGTIDEAKDAFQRHIRLFDELLQLTGQRSGSRL